MNTTERVLDAAEYRMRRGGYNAVSFRDLANDTGIKSSSVHYHFPHKEDLGVALVERYAQRFFDVLENASRKAETPKQKIQAFRSVYRMALSDDDAICLCGLLGAEMAGLPGKLVTAVQSFFDANVKWVEQALPETLSKSDRRKWSTSMVATHQGAMMLATSMGDTKLFDTITKHMVDLSTGQG